MLINELLITSQEGEATNGRQSRFPSRFYHTMSLSSWALLALLSVYMACTLCSAQLFTPTALPFPALFNYYCTEPNMASFGDYDSDQFLDLVVSGGTGTFAAP